MQVPPRLVHVQWGCVGMFFSIGVNNSVRCKPIMVLEASSGDNNYPIGPCLLAIWKFHLDCFHGCIYFQELLFYQDSILLLNWPLTLAVSPIFPPLSCSYHPPFSVQSPTNTIHKYSIFFPSEIFVIPSSLPYT